MSINYKPINPTLAEVIKSSSNINATYVIPDLQRPFVWSPRQVIMLIDSIFKGWPFGTLLLWEVKPDCFEENEGIPHRPFWQIVDRTNDEQGSQASTSGMPATYNMILDGQQRIQSIVLALGGDQWGFKLYDSEWAISMLDKRVKPTEHWSTAVLCIDLHRFAEELSLKERKVRKIEVGKVLDWVVTDVFNGISPGKSKTSDAYPFLISEHPGRFIRLSRFWDLCQYGLPEEEYEEYLKPFLIEHSISEIHISELSKPLAQLLKSIENIKNNCRIHSLQIESFNISKQWTKDDYNDAIVNIFTRLNTAGRTLTREEITLAWLKVGWEKSLTADKPASACLNDLKEVFEESGIDIEMDEVVRLISFVWAIDHKEGVLLDSKDLLKGDIIRPMAKAVSSDWGNIVENIKIGIDFLKDRNVLKVTGSFNAIIVFLAWNRLITNQLFRIKKDFSVPEYDSLEKDIQFISKSFLDRWIFCSQWAGIWGESASTNFENFAKDVYESKNIIEKSAKFNFVINTEESVSMMMNRLLDKAKDYIINVNVRKRNRVSQYFTLLWVWHRLDADRWRYSSIQLKEGKKKNTRLDVDHIVSAKLWEDKINSSLDQEHIVFLNNPEKEEPNAPEGFISTSASMEFINTLGNCALLEKSFNISKSNKAMESFLKEVHEFKNDILTIEEWERYLSIDKKMSDPTNVEIKDIIESIKQRDANVRSDLVQFIEGEKFRVD